MTSPAPSGVRPAGGRGARAREALAFAERTLVAGDALDLVAPDLVATVAALRELTGAAATEAVLDGVFARFCIGK